MGWLTLGLRTIRAQVKDFLQELHTLKKGQAEATKENRHIQQEASIGLTKATEDDDYDYREHAWKQ